MTDIVQLDINAVYAAWRSYLLEHSDAKHFGTVNNQTVAEFPFASLILIGRPTNFTDLVNNEHTIDLTFQTDCYSTSSYSSLYGMDNACWQFFSNLGFQRVGDSTLIEADKNLYRITSRFTLQNFTGRFLNEIQDP